MKRIVTNHGRPIGVFSFSLILCWMAASLLVHPLPDRISDHSAAPLFQGAQIPQSVTNIFSHACIDCHSEKTRWPWYSRVAPVSWLVESDVKRAREHLNLSRWDSFQTSDQRLLLTAIATVIENGEMPPTRYAIFHSEAKLSTYDSVAVIEWTHTETRRLRGSSTAFALWRSIAGIFLGQKSLLYERITHQEHNLEEAH
jgi:hypothetical protein